MFKKLRSIFGKREEEIHQEAGEPEIRAQEECKGEPEAVSPQPEEPQEKSIEVRPLLPHELETFKKGMGITPHNYWTWASRTNNFKLLTDGEYVWVEGYEEHIGKQLPLTQQKAWSWEFIKQRLQDFGGEG